MAVAKKHRDFLKANRHKYLPLLRSQKGGCAICHRPPKNRRLDLDHDHHRMVIRGLLCHKCNRALPDWITIDWLQEAIKYLRKAEKIV